MYCFLVCTCQIRNKLNQEQNSKLQQQKELLNKRNTEVTLMDKRISELRERLYKKKAEARQKENLPVRLGVHLTPHRHKHALKSKPVTHVQSLDTAGTLNEKTEGHNKCIFCHCVFFFLFFFPLWMC